MTGSCGRHRIVAARNDSTASWPWRGRCCPARPHHAASSRCVLLGRRSRSPRPACVRRMTAKISARSSMARATRALIDVAITVPKKSTTGSAGRPQLHGPLAPATSTSRSPTTATSSAQAHRHEPRHRREGRERPVGPRPTRLASARHRRRARVQDPHREPLDRDAAREAHARSVTAARRVARAARRGAREPRSHRERDRLHAPRRTTACPGSLTDQFMTRARRPSTRRSIPISTSRACRRSPRWRSSRCPTCMPPADGLKTPFHGLDMTQFDALIEHRGPGLQHARPAQQQRHERCAPVLGLRDALHHRDVRSPARRVPRLRSRTRPRTRPTPRAARRRTKTSGTTSAASVVCARAGSSRTSPTASSAAWRRTARTRRRRGRPSARKWNADRLGYRQRKNKELAARTMFYAPADEAYLINPNNSLVLLEDRNGDGVGEFLTPGPVTLKTGEQGTLQVNSTGAVRRQPQVPADDAARSARSRPAGARRRRRGRPALERGATRRSPTWAS